MKHYGPKQKTINSNLLLTTNDPDTVTTNLKNQIVADQLTKMSDIGNYFISSFLGLIAKSNTKWRQIYHLIYLRNHSINYYILKKWGVFEYITFNKAKQELFEASPVVL